MLVMMGALVLYTIGTSRALVRADASTQNGFGVLRCLERSRLMLVLLGAPFSHTVSTSEALVRENASISFGSCLVLIGHLLRKASATVEPW